MNSWQAHERALAGGPQAIDGELFQAVSGTISVAHDSPEGARHGHDYHIKVWFRFGHDSRILQSHLDTVLDTLDHTVLPAEISLGEHLARHVAQSLPGCTEVEIERNTRRGGIYARWVRTAITAGTRSAETRSKAPSEGCQSGHRPNSIEVSP
jgi:hypothetical protein